LTPAAGTPGLESETEGAGTPTLADRPRCQRSATRFRVTAQLVEELGPGEPLVGLRHEGRLQGVLGLGEDGLQFLERLGGPVLDAIDLRPHAAGEVGGKALVAGRELLLFDLSRIALRAFDVDHPRAQETHQIHAQQRVEIVVRVDEHGGVAHLGNRGRIESREAVSNRGELRSGHRQEGERGKQRPVLERGPRVERGHGEKLGFSLCPFSASQREMSEGNVSVGSNPLWTGRRGQKTGDALGSGKVPRVQAHFQECHGDRGALGALESGENLSLLRGVSFGESL
jgi:hypothetical protein